MSKKHCLTSEPGLHMASKRQPNLKSFFGNENINQPAEKRSKEGPRTSTDGKRDSQSSSHQRFCTSWLEKFPWLTTENSDGNLKMFCQICRKGGEKNAFTKGSSDFQSSSLVRHRDLEKHKRAAALALRQQQMEEQVHAARKQQASKQTSLMRTVLFMAKEHVADVKFQSLVALQKANGCATLAHGETYKHHSRVTEMQDSLASVTRERQKTDFGNSPYVGIVIDETVNITVHKKLIIFLRIVKNGAHTTLFLGNYTVTSGTAERVFTKVQEVLREKEIESHKVLGLGSDGAAVMLGRHNGVGVRLSEVSPFLIHVHCVAHRCALVASNAAQQTQTVSKFRTTVNGIFKLFKYSAARYERLRQLHAALNPDDFKSLKEPCSVRWLSMTKATQSVFENWPCLVLELDEEATRGNAVAAGLLRQIKQYSFIALASMLMDVLPVMDNLNRFFQRENISLAAIRPKVLMTKHVLEDLRRSKGQIETEFSDHCAANNNTYRGTRLLNVQENAHNNTRNQFIGKLIDNLDDRFPAADLDVISALGKVFDVQRYPVALDDGNYGEDAIDVIADKLGQATGGVPAIVSSHLLRATFPLFKTTLRSLGNLNFFEACQHTILDYQEEFPQFYILANVALCLPVSSVPCERGFSLQNQIKTSQRSRLTDKKVDALMLLSMEAPAFDSPSVDCFLEEAALDFSRNKERYSAMF